MTDTQLAQNPLTTREQRIIEANSVIQDSCPNPDCDITPTAVDLTEDGTLYVSHVEDGVGLGSRSAHGDTDGCRIGPEEDPTLDN